MLSHERANSSHRVNVSAIDLSSWMQKHLRCSDFIVLKIDIEGAEYKVLPALVKSGMVCMVDLLLVEWHSFSDPIKPTPFGGRSVAAEDIERSLELCKTKPLYYVNWH